jgi:hypothetical protein
MMPDFNILIFMNNMDKVWGERELRGVKLPCFEADDPLYSRLH